MAVENASTPDQLDPSLPAGTDFKNEGDNHIRLIKAVIQNTLGGLEGSASQTEAQNITSPGNNKIMTALRVFEQITARLITQTLAEGGADNSRLMTSLRTKQQIDARLANATQAASGTDATKLLTSLGAKQYIDGRRATQTQAEGASDVNVLLTPLRGGQLAQKLFNDNYTAKVATQTQSDDGAADNVTITPLKARVTGDGRYLRLAQTTAFTRSLLDDTSASAARGTLGLGNAAEVNRSTSVSSTSTTTVATSSAVRLAYLSAGQGPTGGTTYLLKRFVSGFTSHPSDSYRSNDDITYDQGRNCAAHALLSGTITVYLQQVSTGANDFTSSDVRVLKNGSQVAAWTLNDGTVTRTVNISVVPGDLIIIQGKQGGSGTTAGWQNVSIRSGTRVGAVA